MMKLLNRSFRNRLAAAFLVASLVPLLVCSASLLEISRLRMKSHTESEAQIQARNMGQALDRMTSGFSDAAEALGRSALISRALSGGKESDTSVYSALFTATAGMREWASFELYDTDGQGRYSTRNAFRPRTLPTDWGILYAAQEDPGQSVDGKKFTCPDLCFREPFSLPGRPVKTWATW